MSSFSDKKRLKFVITLGTDRFDAAGNDTVVIDGFRAKVDISNGGGAQMSTLAAQIYGLSQDKMNKITTLRWKSNQQILNTIAVYAIDGARETLVFAGNIFNAMADYQNVPNVFLSVQAQNSYAMQMKAVEPLSIKGGQSVVNVVAVLADKMGLKFIPNGLTGTLTDTYEAGSLIDQLRAIAKAARFEFYADNKKLEITKTYAPTSAPTCEVSPQTGLVGYPTFDSVGVSFTTLFNPTLTHGCRVNLKTDIKQAAGVWKAAVINHMLESENPSGAWFSFCRANLIGDY